MTAQPVLIRHIAASNRATPEHQTHLALPNLADMRQMDPDQALLLSLTLQLMESSLQCPRFPPHTDRLEIWFNIGAGATVKYRLDHMQRILAETVGHPDTGHLPRWHLATTVPEGGSFTSVLAIRPDPEDHYQPMDQRTYPLPVAQIQERLDHWAKPRHQAGAKAIIERETPLPRLITIQGWEPETDTLLRLSEIAQTIIRPR